MAVHELLILGVGVHAIEMAEIAERAFNAGAQWRPGGFVSPDGRRTGEVLNGYPVLGGPEVLEQRTDAGLVPAFGWPEQLEVPQERLISLVDPSAFVSRTARIGAGCVIYPGSFAGLNARIGDRVFCLSGSILNHDVVLEERVVVASGVTLAGSVYVESDCYLGQSCTVRQHLRIGAGSLIGMGAVVIRDVPPNSVMVGNPARRLRDRR
jgi:sugar O-acyltransferase (sialic acid O-acetyltransferase NeuD family)